MNAKELHRLMVAGRIVLADPTTGHPHMPADQEIAHRALSLLAFADALEENARLKGSWGASALAENARLKAAWDASHKQAMKNGAACNEWRDRANRAEAELAKLRQRAEAMADDLDRFAAQPDYDGPLYGPMPSLIAYRADFPEEPKCPLR